MYKLTEASLEWALRNLERTPDSDLFPKLFEFESIRHDWVNIKQELLTFDFHIYTPKAPVTYLAPKPRGGFRVVHQLDPIDSILYTALVYESCEHIERFRLPISRNIACSYRILCDLDGGFFNKNYNGYSNFIERNKALATKFKGGYVLTCDITDFYNQIYLHRVCNVLEESNSVTGSGKAIETFLSKLNTKISRGVPVGPQPSIIIAEAIMADIDNKIVRETHDFTRYVDDINIFFNSSEKAYLYMHELTNYLYSNHRLVLSSEKTKIVSCGEFRSRFIDDEDRHEKQAIHEKIEEISNDYPEGSEEIDFEELPKDQKFSIRSKAYVQYLEKALQFQQVDFGLVKHILKKAKRYKVRSLLPVILNNFYKLSPAINYTVPYLMTVMNDSIAEKYKEDFSKLLTNEFLKLPYINLWIFTLFQHPSFNIIVLNFPYIKIIRFREAALIAKSRKDLIWVKDMKNRLDLVGPWDKRAIIYASSVLSNDEKRNWLQLEESKGNLLEKAVYKKILSI